MREIKFRVWSKILKKIITHEELEKMLKDLTKMEFISGIFLPLNSDSGVMQYTGVKDIEGNEIYEGDIVTSESTGPECGLGCFFKGVVNFYEGTFYIDNEETEFCIPLFHETNELRVIGNIYE